MEKEYFYVGVTVDEAIKKGLKDLSLTEDAVKIEVIEGGSAGIFGLFKKEAKVKLIPLDEEYNKEEAVAKVIEVEKKEEELNKEKGISDSINFGSQIRNYVLEPYTLVKDLRSGYETSQAFKVLDGDILPIMESVLKMKKN